MMAFAFYLFAVLACVAGFMVVISKNPVHSVLWLILTFLCASGLFVLAGAEFVAMLLIIVYVGAVAVLFLFVVMMLDVDFAELKGELARFLPLGLVIAAVLLTVLGMSFAGWQIAPGAADQLAAPIPADMGNTNSIATVLYDRYFLAFQLAGLILLVAMIGAIVLTIRHRRDIKRQNVLKQMWTDPAKQLELRDVKPGQGL
ncbi:MAG TPA: NADH-quinone oxidoreductase subunit J [Paracoccus sp. (in: a-proteobacteria)]|uniref:NADH-quinone oxidoreductase subunit J n=1 Tax=uncultured Paracoccus sp. TaxID=189685 RepID=UPI002605F3C9|nr:NADH-quinone oxidoreductase subunit J [uncultured Paracoccus sp.]HMQ41131.1 NADH-quinone oxidoreductase subunit J [Paracoccus sp. (in: a-proteobacteria)]HMR36031.1 NADH-quinone oxidoreductase subunit J [Paracoccus sp. (in: a-proteobacteria)]